MKLTHKILLCTSAPLVACSAVNDAPGNKFEVSVAALELPGITQATYNLTVRNADAAPDNVVWSQSGLTSTQYGDGRGALTYIGTCDASRNPHTVELELVSLADATHTLSSPGDFANPAPVGRPIVLTNIMCEENADVPVVFDLTIMRAAKQGFFDIAVNFDDIFCSAKLDCKDELLHNEAGERDTTVVFGFACTAGIGDSTFMYLSDLTLTCSDADGSNPVVTRLPTSGREDGQQGRAGDNVYDWAQYSVVEFVDNANLDKCGWNFSIGLDTDDLANKRCTVSAVGTAAGAALVGLEVPSGGAYPVIQWDVEVLSPGGALCSNNGLNVEGSGVRTGYIKPGDTLPDLTAEHLCGTQPEKIACGASTPVGAVNVVPAGSTFTIEVAGVANPTTFTLPDGWAVASECCEANCCNLPSTPVE